MQPVIVKEFRLKLYPKDFARIRDFYENHLQFPIIHEWDRGEISKGVMFDVGGTTLELLNPADGGYKEITGADISLEVPDVEELWRQMKDSYDVLHPLRHNAWGDTSFRIADPEGFPISFFTRDAPEIT